MNKPVSFDLAKLLKEKNIDIPCSDCYAEKRIIDRQTGGDLFIGEYKLCGKSKFHKRYYSAPTISEVVMWLYEKHGIWVLVDWSQTKWCFSIIDIKEETVKKVSGEKWKERSSGVYLKTLLDFNSPIEAYEAAIEYCLTKLI